MSNYFFSEPTYHASQFGKHQHCKNHTLQTLAGCVHQECPLCVNIASVTRREQYVVYNCTVSSVTAQMSWCVSYRYSEFLKFRNNVNELWTCDDKDCSGSCQAIRDITTAFFPRKLPRILSTQYGAVNHRKVKLENVLAYLLRCILLPGSAMKCFHARQNLPPNLFEFLMVKREADKRSLMQVFVDNHQPIRKSLTSPNLASKMPSENSIIIDHCIFCLDIISIHASTELRACCSDSTPIILQCQHAFHRECIFEWLLFQYQCPVCRAQVGPSAVTNYCRPRNQVQWWLGDFEKRMLSTPVKQTDVNTRSQRFH